MGYIASCLEVLGLSFVRYHLTEVFVGMKYQINLLNMQLKTCLKYTITHYSTYLMTCPQYLNKSVYKDFHKNKSVMDAFLPKVLSKSNIQDLFKFRNQ